MNTIVIIAAMERELTPLVRDWKAVAFNHAGRSFRAFERQNLVALAGGIGGAAARNAANAAIAQFQPEMLISAGLAGALDDTLKVGSVFTPNAILDASNGAEYHCDTGEGTLVTSGEIAGTISKHALAAEYHAAAVDMEAAAVAEAARQAGIAFFCVKAISDEAGFVMPPLSRFVSENGEFQTARFVSWLALRPKYWRQTMILARNTNLAAQALGKWLAERAQAGFSPSRVVKIEAAKLSQTKP